MKKSEAIEFIEQVKVEIGREADGIGGPGAEVLAAELTSIINVPLRVIKGEYTGTPNEAALEVLATYGLHELLIRVATTGKEKING